jgi:hypothetical protein
MPLCFGKTNLKKQQYDFLNWYILNNTDKISDLSNITQRFDNFAFDQKLFDNFEINDEKYKGKMSAADHRFFKKQIAYNDSIKSLDITLIKYTGWKANVRTKQYPISSIKFNTRTGQPGLDSKTLFQLVQPSKMDVLIEKTKLQLPATTISLPIFTKDGNIAFINRTYNCEGLCASGGIEVYRKLNGEWKFYGYITQWQS